MTAAAPASDKRLKLLDAAIKKSQKRADALIEVLHRAQELFGFLDTPILWHVARALKQPPSRVYGVATFYHLFRLKPQGEHTCVVCLGTACFVKGAEKLIQTADAVAHVKPDQTTADGKVSFLTARCIGACGIAPAVVFDSETSGHVTPDQMTQRLKGWLGDGSR